MSKIKVITRAGVNRWNYEDVASIMDFYKLGIFNVIDQYHKRHAFMRYLKALCPKKGIEDWDLYALLTYHWKHIFKKIGLHDTAIGMAEFYMANDNEEHHEMDVERETQ